MCGIIAEFKKNEKHKANDFIINQYEEQYKRGTEGFGIINIDKNNKIKITRACEPTKFLLDLYTNKSQIIIAHHRKPTSTENKINQTHPIIISNKILKYDYAIIHNGIISNDKELKTKHEKLGFVYKTEYKEKGTYYETTWTRFNDSETIAIELALYIENKIPELNIKNMATFIIVQINKKTQKANRILFGRTKETSELKIEETKTSIKISSEGPGEKIEADKLFSFKINKKIKIKKEDLNIKEEEKIEKKKETNINKIKTISINNETNKEIKEKDLPPYRDWIIDIKEEEEEMTLLPLENYISQNCKEIIETMNNTITSERICEIVEQELDEHVNTIIDIAHEYKDTLIRDRLSKEKIEEYAEALKTIIKTMSHITNISEKFYKETALDEEISSYNSERFEDNSTPITDIDDDVYWPKVSKNKIGF